MKIELKILKFDLDYLKNYVVTRFQNKPQKNNKENFENPYVFEHESIKIKLEKVENHNEEKLKIKQEIGPNSI